MIGQCSSQAILFVYLCNSQQNKAVVQWMQFWSVFTVIFVFCLFHLELEIIKSFDNCYSQCWITEISYSSKYARTTNTVKAFTSWEAISLTKMAYFLFVGQLALCIPHKMPDLYILFYIAICFVMSL